MRRIQLPRLRSRGGGRRRPFLIGAILLLGIAAAGTPLGLVLSAENKPTAGPGVQVSANYLQLINDAAKSCPTLSAPRIAAQLHQQSTFNAKATGANGAAGMAMLPAKVWQKWRPSQGASPTDAKASIEALAHYMCDLVGQNRVAGVPGEPWELALAAFKSSLDEVKKAHGVPADPAVRQYVSATVSLAAWYARQVAFGGPGGTPPPPPAKGTASPSGTRSASPTATTAPTTAPPVPVPGFKYNNVGISDDSAMSTADIDGGGFSYSAQALASVGVRPGGAVSAGGATFRWPDVAAGQPDNYQGAGQTISLTAAAGAGTLYALGAAVNGSVLGTAVLTYTDGSTENVQLGFPDWVGFGFGQPSLGVTVAATMPYRNGFGGRDGATAHLFVSAPISLAAGKVASSITLPSVSRGELHIFAFAVQ